MLHVCMVFCVGMACRWRAASVLSKRFKSPHKADTHFSVMMQPSLEDASMGHYGTLFILDSNDQLMAISRLFSQYLNQHTPVRSVPPDFLSLVERGMSHLQECNRSNVISTLWLRCCVLLVFLREIHYYQ